MFNTEQKPGDFTPALPVFGGNKIEAGSIVIGSDAGDVVYDVPTAIAEDLGKALGVAAETADNTNGVDGDVTVIVQRGVFAFCVSGANPPVLIGSRVYAEDNETASNDNTKPALGVFLGLDADGKAVVDTTQACP